MAFRLLRRGWGVVPARTRALALAALSGLAGLALASRLPAFLAPNAPLGRGVLVVEGWMDGEELGRAAEAYRRGRYQALLVTGGPIPDAPEGRGPRSYAERAGERMRQLGIAEPALAVVPAPATEHDHTYQSALAVRGWLAARQPPVSALDLASHGPHSRRSRAIYRAALGEGVEVGVIAVEPSEYAMSRWWLSRQGVEDVLTQAAEYAWVRCCFRPPPAQPRPGVAGPARP